MKPGYKTTEFAVTLLTVLGGAASLVLHRQINLLPYLQLTITILTVASALAYLVSRTLLKFHAISQSQAAVVEDVAETIDPGVDKELAGVFTTFVAPVAGAQPAAGHADAVPVHLA